MAKKMGIYKCNVCGNIVEVLFAGQGILVCCGQNMQYMEENTTDAAKEKHVPVIEKTANGVRVSVGSVAHPMTEEHYIQWIELLVDGRVLRQELKPGGKPMAEFPAVSGALMSAREYCNLHGLWKA